MLAASGLLAVGALSGCLNRAASATTKTKASPAASFGGVGAYTGPSPTADPTVYKLTPTLSAESGQLSGDVELEAWVTARAIAADCCFDYNDGQSKQTPSGASYNNSRSNRATIQGPGDVDSDDDGLDDAVETRATALELEQQLLSQTAAAVDSISKRSARTGRNHIADMSDTIRDVQATLERCSDDVCVTVRAHADGRLKLTQQATAHVESGEWDRAADAIREIETIVEGDIDTLESSLDDATPDHSSDTPRLQDLTGASDEEIEALYEYLAGEPVISEQFTITVPDARLSDGGDDIILGDYITARRIIEYVTGRAETDGHVYAWGDNRVSTERDNTSPIYEGDAVGGESAIHRGSIMDDGGDTDENPFRTSDALRSAVSGPVDTGIHLDARGSGGTVTVHVVNDPPRAAERRPAIAVSADGSSVEPADFDDWGAERGESAATSTLVCPILVAPPDCPSPFPALLYVRRCAHDEQYIYTGGWVIDDGSLYEDSRSLLAAGGPPRTLGVDETELEGYGDLMTRRLSGDRERRGARLLDGTLSAAVDQGVSLDCDDDDCRVTPEQDATEETSGDDKFVCHSNHLSAPIVHFTGANASESVKFKAGAELSKSVN